MGVAEAAEAALVWLDRLPDGLVAAGLELSPGVTVADPCLFLVRLRSDLAGDAGHALQALALGHINDLTRALFPDDPCAPFPAS